MKNMINKYGNPDAVVFSNTLDSYNLICGFDDIFKINANELSDQNILNEFQNKINSWNI